MADQRAEARRRRILQDPAKRLERLKNLSRRCEEETQVVELKEDNALADKEDQGTIRSHQEPCCENEAVDEPDQVPNQKEEQVDDSFKNECRDDELDESFDDNVLLEKESPEMSVKPSWIRRKYRFLLFTLLAWTIYMVVAKEFHFVFAYLIGTQLPDDVVPVLIPTAFVAVEVQVVILSLLVPSAPQEKSSASMLVLGLSLCGIPRTFLDFVGGVSGTLMASISDLCVYIFVIVCLKVLDEKVF